jgi:hypothetical protein
LSRPHIGVLERGLDLPRLDTIAKLAAGTNISNLDLRSVGRNGMASRALRR